MNNISSEHRSTSRVLDILVLLSKNPEGYTLAEISRELNAPKSSLFPIIHTMEARNFLQLNSETSKYCIGQQTYLAGSSYVSSRPVYNFIQNELNFLTKECLETCHLGVLSGSNVLYLAKKEAINPIMLRSHTGQQLPAYCSGIGKALLTGCTEEALDALYPEPLTAYTANTITHLDLLKQELENARKTGFAYENAELTEGIACIAIPLRFQKKVIAAISICYPQFRSSEELLLKFQKLLLQVQEEIEHYFLEFHIDDSRYLF